MPAKHFILPEKIRKRARKFPLRVEERISQAYRLLKQNPLLGEKLHGELVDYYKLRIGDYRIIYRFDAKKSLVEIVKIEHRQGVYR